MHLHLLQGCTQPFVMANTWLFAYAHTTALAKLQTKATTGCGFLQAQCDQTQFVL